MDATHARLQQHHSTYRAPHPRKRSQLHVRCCTSQIELKSGRGAKGTGTKGPVNQVVSHIRSWRIIMVRQQDSNELHFSHSHFVSNCCQLVTTPWAFNFSLKVWTDRLWTLKIKIKIYPRFSESFFLLVLVIFVRAMEPKTGYDYLGKEEDFVNTPISTGVCQDWRHQFIF